MWKKALSVVLLVGAAYGAYHAFKDGRAWFQKRKAAAAVPPPKK